MMRTTVTTGIAATFAAALFGLAQAPTASAVPDVDPFGDLYGTSTSTTGLDNLLLSVDPTLAGQLDSGSDLFNAAVGVDADPFSDLVSSFDPNAFLGGSPHDLFGDLAVSLDSGGGIYDLPALLGPSIDPFVNGFITSMVSLDGLLGF